MPADAPNAIALETAGRVGFVALGVGYEYREKREIPRTRRHNLELVPTLDALLRDHGLTPRDLGEAYVSLGPGSFTGLRMAIATAQMLALVHPDLRLVGVPTLDVLAHQHRHAAEHVAIMLNLKRGTSYCAVYRDGGCILEPALRTNETLLAEAPRPLAVVAEVDPALPDNADAAWVPADAPDAEVTWRIGHDLARAGKFTDPPNLLPLYIREPEAVTLWDQREKEAPR